MEKYNMFGFIRKEYKKLYRRCIADETFAEFGAFSLKFNDYLNVRLYHTLKQIS